MRRVSVATYNFTKKNHIFASYYENATRNITVVGANMNAFDRFVQHQIGELVNASQVSDQCSSIPQQHHQFFCIKFG